jgi:preprotein translocase subunit SecG
MSFLIGILTFFLVINCALLILLVLVQLPKKDAGAGLAFGGGAADALFGAGSGNALTKITKYSTIIFFALALAIGFMQDHAHRGNSTLFEQQVNEMQKQAPAAAPTTPQMTSPTAPKNNLLSVPLTDTNAPAAPAPAK